MQVRPKVMKVLGKANCARGNQKRGGQDGAPEDKKACDSSIRLSAECMSKVEIGTAGKWHGGSQLCPHKSIAEGNDRAKRPGKQNLRTMYGDQYKWNA